MIHNLEAEGFPLRIGPDAKQEIVNSGDVMFDAALFYAKRAEGRSAILTVNVLKAKGYVLATVHRTENPDDPLRLRAIMEGLEAAADQIPVVLPSHPRTRAAMEREGVNVQKILLIDPVGYLEMVVLEVNASIIATDSGGVQKEACF